MKKFFLMIMGMVIALSVQAQGQFVLAEGDQFQAGAQVTTVPQITLTFGKEGSADFKAAKADTKVDGYTAYTEGNGNNGEKEDGTFYLFAPEKDGQVTVAVVLNADKKFFVEEDGTALSSFNGIMVTEKYYGTFTFSVSSGKTYKVYCSGSKLGFYGFSYKVATDLAEVVSDCMYMQGGARSYTIELEAGGLYKLSAPIITNRGLTITSPKNNPATIDASSNTGAFILMDKTPTSTKTAKNFYEVEGVTIQNLIIKGVNSYLFYDNNIAYAFNNFALENCLVEMTNTGEFNAVIRFQAGGAYKYSIKNNTLYHSGKKNNAKYIVQQSSGNFPDKSDDNSSNVFVNLTKQYVWEIENNTFFRAFKSNKFLDGGRVGNSYNKTTADGKKFVSISIQRNIFYDTSVTGANLLQNLFGGKQSDSDRAKFASIITDDNSYFDAEGVAVSGPETYDKGRIFKTAPVFANTATGDFTLAEDCEQYTSKTGDPRWLKNYAAGTVEVSLESGANLTEAVAAAFADNGKPGAIILQLAKDAKYTVSGALFVNCPLYINGAEGVEIDAAASNAPFILMRPLPELGLNDQGAFEISEISIKDVKITGLKNRLFYANRQNYLIGKLAVENSVIQVDGTTPRSIFDFYCGGNYEELSIVNSTLYAEPSNAMRSGLISTQASLSVIELGGKSQKLSIKNSTLYNIAKGMTPVLQQRHSQYYLSFELAGNIIVNCGEKGNFVAGLNDGHKSSEVKWAVANNVFNFDGEDTGKQEAYGNAIPSAVDFADAAKGNFTLSALNAAFQRGIGDPRWLVPGEGSVLIKAKDGSDLTALLEEAAGDKIPNVVVIKLDKNATVTVSKPIVFANSLYIDVPESDILSPASATIDASGLEGPMITTPAEAPAEWVVGNVSISDVKVKGLKKALFASATKNYFYETFAIMGCVVEQAGDATTLDFTKGSVAKDLLISLSTFYAPTATTKSFYSSQSGQKATEYNEGIQQRFAIFGNTMYNLAPTKNFFSHRQSNQKWLVYSVQSNIFVNCGKSGQVIKGINGGQQGTNPTWIVANNIFNFDGEDTSAKEETGDADEPVKGSAAGVMTFNSVETPDFGGVFTLAEGAAKPDAIGDVYHWTVTYNEIVTGIEAVKTAEGADLENAVIYNLNGQRIDKAQAKSGVFIVNGKKVVIK